MSSNLLFFGWNRSIPGRERESSEHFQDFSNYLGNLRQNGEIDTFQVVFLDNHGGDLNGFFLIHADDAQLDAVCASRDWRRHMTRAGLHLDGSGAVRGATGAEVLERMSLWNELIPS